MAEDDFIDYDLLREVVLAAVGPGKSTRPRTLSLEATQGTNPDLIRNFLKKGTRPSPPAVAGIAQALGYHLTHFWKDWDGPLPVKKSWLLVNSDVEAGVWREQVEWGPADWYELQVAPSDRGRRHVFGAVVRGRSMDRVLPPGTVLRCEDVIGALRSYGDGDYAIVERTKHGLVELTCKRLHRREDGAWELRAESYLPEFHDPIQLGSPADEDASLGFQAEGEEVRVRGVVLDAYLPIGRRITRPVA